MSLNVPLLRQSFDLVAEANPKFISRFYDILFTRYPQAKPLFARNARAQQEKMLTDALVAVLDHIESAPWLQSTLGGMGAKHVEYGVTTEMYGWVGESLLATLAETAGPQWDAELNSAWTAAYQAISGLMIEGAKAAKGANA